MLPQLKPEIWLVIFKLLRQPLPRPHTNLGPNRSIIRQAESLPFLRVCKEWYNIAAISFYRLVVTDNLELFLYHGSIPIPGIHSKLSLLGHVCTLYIEYSYKDASYEGLGTEELEGSKGKEESKVDRKGWKIELENELASLRRAMERLLEGPAPRFGPDLTRLHSLCVGAFFGHEEEAIQALCFKSDMWRKYGKEVIAVRFLCEHFLRATTSIQRFCQSVQDAPLSIQSLSFPTPDTGISDISPNFSNHSSARDLLDLQLPDGAAVKWYIHQTQSRQKILQQLKCGFALTAEIRSDLAIQAQEMGLGDIVTETTFDCTIYLAVLPANKGQSHTVAHGVTQTTEIYKLVCRKEMEEMQRSINSMLNMIRKDRSKRVKMQDRVDVVPLIEAPPCAACGWRCDQ